MIRAIGIACAVLSLAACGGDVASQPGQEPPADTTDAGHGADVKIVTVYSSNHGADVECAVLIGDYISSSRSVALDCDWP